MKFVTDKEPKQPVETDQEVIFTYDVLFQVRRRERGVTQLWHPHSDLHHRQRAS